MNKETTEHINHILASITPYCDSFQASPGEILHYTHHNSHYCYLLLDGAITLNRRGDGMILSRRQHPFILGVNHLISDADFYIHVIEPSLISRMPLEEFHLLVEKFALWESFCYLLAYSTSHIYEQWRRTSQSYSHDVVQFQLKQLMREPLWFRNSITATHYILDRSILSRSEVMHILKRLRATGCITLRRGILIDIDHLPVHN